MSVQCSFTALPLEQADDDFAASCFVAFRCLRLSLTY